MPAYAFEVDEAEAEGVTLSLLTNPVRIVGENGRVTGVEMVEMRLGEPDASGRRRPLPVPGSNYVVEADAVILAIGQQPDLAFLPKDVRVTPAGTIAHDAETRHQRGGHSPAERRHRPRSAIGRWPWATGWPRRSTATSPARRSLPRIAEEDVVLSSARRWRKARLGQTGATAGRTWPSGPSRRVNDFDELALGFTEKQAARGQALPGLRRVLECYRCVEACKPGHRPPPRHLLGCRGRRRHPGPGVRRVRREEKYELGYSRFRTW